MYNYELIPPQIHESDHQTSSTSTSKTTIKNLASPTSSLQQLPTQTQRFHHAPPSHPPLKRARPIASHSKQPNGSSAQMRSHERAALHGWRLFHHRNPSPQWHDNGLLPSRRYLHQRAQRHRISSHRWSVHRQSDPGRWPSQEQHPVSSRDLDYRFFRVNPLAVL